MRARWWLLGACVVLLLVAATAVWGVLAALSARTDLEAVRADIAGVRAAPPQDIAGLQAAVSRSRDRAAAARSTMHQPGPALMARVPVLGRTWRAETAIADAGAALLDTADQALPALAAISTGGRVDLDQLAAIERTLTDGAARSRGPLGTLADLDTRSTPGAVQRAVATAQDQLGGLDTTLARGADAIGALRGLLGADGPRTILIGLENNSELRGTGGLISSFAYATSLDGVLRVEPFLDSAPFEDPQATARTVPAPPDYVAAYGPYLANTTFWKNAPMSPDIPTSAQVLSQAAAAMTGRPSDAVVLLDVPALAAIARSTGPLNLGDGQQIPADQLTRALLVDAYVEGQGLPGSQVERRQRLQAAASDGLRRLLADGVPPLTTARAMSDAVAGRHLAVWSARPAEQERLVRAGLAGGVEPGPGEDLVAVTVNNLGGNKLDYYVRRQVAVDVTVGPTDAVVKQTVTFTNTAPGGLPPYVLGLADSPRWTGEWQIATATTAKLASVTQDGAEVAVRQRVETGSNRVVGIARLDQGQSTTIEVVYKVPLVDGTWRARLIPQPLATDAELTLNARSSDAAVPLREDPSRSGAFRTTATVTAAR